MPNLDLYPEQRQAEFLERFPEFAPAGALVPAALLEAARRVNIDALGPDTREDAIRWLAAHTLAVSPWGRNQRLANDDNTSTYLTEFERIRAERVPRMIVT